MEKNLKKNIYIYMNPFAVHQKLTQHRKSTVLQKNPTVVLMKNNNNLTEFEAQVDTVEAIITS